MENIKYASVSNYRLRQMKRWHNENLTRFEELSIEDRIDEYECALRFLITAVQSSGKKFDSRLEGLFQRNQVYFVDEKNNNEWLAINPNVGKLNIPNFNSDINWANKPISSFKEYFDIKDLSDNKQILNRVNRVKDKLVSETIIYYAHRLYEYNHLVHSCQDIVSSYDIVNTRYGPTILTSSENIDEIRYVRKALLLLFNLSQVNQYRNNINRNNSILDYLQLFDEIDNESYYEDTFNYCISCNRSKTL